MQDVNDLAGLGAAAPRRPTAEPAAPALRAAREFEAAFLAEMLKHAGFGEAPDAFGGGPGEDQFAGFMREAQAREIAAAGGVGIAEYVIRHLDGGKP